MDDIVTIQETGHEYCIFQLGWDEHGKQLWHFEPMDYEGDVQFSESYATRKDAYKAADLWDQDLDDSSHAAACAIFGKANSWW